MRYVNGFCTQHRWITRCWSQLQEIIGFLRYLSSEIPLSKSLQYREVRLFFIFLFYFTASLRCPGEIYAAGHR